MTPWSLSPDRCFSPDPAQRRVARELYAQVGGLPLLCPHGHVPPALLADPEARLGSPAELFIIPDHYITRMLYSQGVPLEDLGVPTRDGAPVERDHRKIWQRFAEGFHLFRATPTGLWLADELVSGQDRMIASGYKRTGSVGIASGAAEVQLDLIARNHLDLPRRR